MLYRLILLAYDGTREGRVALREGALLARRCRAEVFLLAVVGPSTGVQIAEGAFPGAIQAEREAYRAILDEGAERLRALGFTPKAKLVEGEPAPVISEVAKAIGADLVVVGHRRQGLVARWWSGSTGAYLLDHVGCSLLVARRTLTDTEFAAEMQAAAEPTLT